MSLASAMILDVALAVSRAATMPAPNEIRSPTPRNAAMDQMGVSFVGAMTSSMTSLMARASATLNTARAIMKDAQFHAEASRLQAEVSALMGDVGRLTTRANAFKRHLAQAESDIDGVETSIRAIEKRGARIADMDLGAADTVVDKLEAKDS